jgi:broad specificity phosphatase PhoE
MTNMFRIIFALAIALICTLRPVPALADDLPIAQLDPAQFNVVFMRHALAPGFGDPDHFDVTDCATQRNLDDRGRAQARDIGQAFAQAGVVFDQIYSSQWCRCQDTARLLGLGSHVPFAGLNSFFQNHAPRDATLALLRQKLKQLPTDRITLLVTHQVVINAMTGRSVPSGGAVAYDTRTGQAKPLTIR